jgi:hypothetical protein
MPQEVQDFVFERTRRLTKPLVLTDEQIDQAFEEIVTLIREQPVPYPGLLWTMLFGVWMSQQKPPPLIAHLGTDIEGQLGEAECQRRMGDALVATGKWAWDGDDVVPAFPPDDPAWKQ